MEENLQPVMMPQPQTPRRCLVIVLKVQRQLNDIQAQQTLERRRGCESNESEQPSPAVTSNTEPNMEHGETSASKFPMPRISKDSSQVQVEAVFAISKGTYKPIHPGSDYSPIPPAIINLTEITPVSEEEYIYCTDGMPRFIDSL
ncbi:hypothetical protein BGX38DRAFT_1181884 [Terfezia claveryi]|nr:hypothetical protein BGX38DRAFT_1181884 [Terfezia claveryi]